MDADERARLRRTTDSHTPIKGRRWRRTDPGLDEATRQLLVDELMTARRMVKTAKGDDDATATARARVNDAKVALGERGPRWWEDQTPDEVATRAAAVARTLERSNGDVLDLDEAIRLVGIEPIGDPSDPSADSHSSAPGAPSDDTSAASASAAS